MDIKTKQTIIQCLISGAITIPFFYLPFSRILELVVIVLFFVEIFHCFKKKGGNLMIFFVHYLTMIALLYFAPQEGRNKEIDTSKWNGYTLEDVLQSISQQTGFFVSIKGIPITSQKITEDPSLQEILKQKINWDKQKLTAEEAAYFLTKETDLEFIIKESNQKFLWASLSGHWTSFSVPVYEKKIDIIYSKPSRLTGWL